MRRSRPRTFSSTAHDCRDEVTLTCTHATVTDRERTARRLFPMSGLQRALVAFRRTSAARARSRPPTRRSVAEGRNLALEARQQKDHPGVLDLSVTADGLHVASSYSAGGHSQSFLPRKNPIRWCKMYAPEELGRRVHHNGS